MYTGVLSAPLTVEVTSSTSVKLSRTFRIETLEPKSGTKPFVLSRADSLQTKEWTDALNCGLSRRSRPIRQILTIE